MLARPQKWTWKRNGLRHSFISYRLAEIKNVHQVSLEAGNSPQMVFAHYRQLVTETQAKEWFAIMPPKPAAPAPTITTTAAGEVKPAAIRRKADDAWTFQRN